MKKILLLLTILSVSIHSQAQVFYGAITSVLLTDSRELMACDYTINAAGVIDMNVGTATSNSYLPAGTILYVDFPINTDLTSVTTITAISTSNNATFPPDITNGNSLEFTLPFALQRGENISLIIRNVMNPPIDPLCGSNNSYHSAAPCNHSIFFGGYNSLMTANIYTHNGNNLYTITPSNYFVSNITIEKPNGSSYALSGSMQNELLLLTININGSTGSFPSLEELIGLLLGNTNMSNFEIWYTGNKKTFHAPIETLLYSQSNPSSIINLNTLNQSLVKGENFIWIVVDIPCESSVLNQQIDATLSQLTISGTDYFPTDINGIRTIYNQPIPSTNLVSNPGFETYSSCPLTYTGISAAPVNNEIAKATGWNYLNPGVIIGTSDYFNSCASGTLVDVPYNTFTGHQIPHGGNAYAGLGSNGYFEYISTQLSAPLIKDTVYVMSFYTVSAEGNFYKSNGIGAYLSTVPIIQTSYTNQIPYSPQVLYNPIIYDENDWVLVCDTFVAAGGEQWLIIGGFLANNIANTYIPNTAPSSYVLIDDVNLVKRSQTTTLCPSIPLRLEEYDNRYSNVQSKNTKGINRINTNEFQLVGISEIQEFEVFNSNGSHIDISLSSEQKINMEKYTSGMYIVKIRTKEEFLIYKMINE